MPPRILKIVASRNFVRLASTLNECELKLLQATGDLLDFLYFASASGLANICKTPLEPIMRDINEVLREKETALARINRELEALRIVAPLLAEEPIETEAPPKIEPERAESEAKPLRKRWP